MSASPVVPVSGRCQRNDGKGWRCSQPKEVENYCRDHYNYSIRHRGGRASASVGQRSGGRGRGSGRPRKDERSHEDDARGFVVRERRSGRRPNAEAISDDEVIVYEKREKDKQLMDGESDKSSSDEDAPVAKVVADKGKDVILEVNGKRERNSPVVHVESIEEENPVSKAGAKKTPLMCHQCKRNDRGRVVCCNECGRKRYCIRCISRRYPHISEADIAKRCPFCCNNCNCKACLRKKRVVINKPRKVITNEAKEAIYIDENMDDAHGPRTPRHDPLPAEPPQAQPSATRNNAKSESDQRASSSGSKRARGLWIIKLGKALQDLRGYGLDDFENVYDALISDEGQAMRFLGSPAAIRKRIVDRILGL